MSDIVLLSDNYTHNLNVIFPIAQRIAWYPLKKFVYKDMHLLSYHQVFVPQNCHF